MNASLAHLHPSTTLCPAAEDYARAARYLDRYSLEMARDLALRTPHGASLYLSDDAPDHADRLAISRAGDILHRLAADLEAGLVSDLDRDVLVVPSEEEVIRAWALERAMTAPEETDVGPF